MRAQGRSIWSKRGIENTRKAAEWFAKAVEIDPSLALGYVGQADCYTIFIDWGLNIKENLVKVKELVTKALELDPELAEAHTTKGNLLRREYKLRQAEDEFRKAIELKPGYATAHQWFFHLLESQLRWEEALEQIEKAVELDPLSPVMILNLGSLYFQRRDYEKAIELFKRAAKLDPSYASPSSHMVSAYGYLKGFDDMKREATILVGLTRETVPKMKVWLDAVMASLQDDLRSLRTLMPGLEADAYDQGSSAFFVAESYFRLGEKERRFEWLDRSYSNGEDIGGQLLADPELDGIRNDPRYFELLKRLGLD